MYLMCKLAATQNCSNCFTMYWKKQLETTIDVFVEGAGATRLLIWKNFLLENIFDFVLLCLCCSCPCCFQDVALQMLIQQVRTTGHHRSTWIGTLWAAHSSLLIYKAVVPTDWSPQVTTNLSVICCSTDHFTTGVIKELSTRGHQSWLKQERKGSC